jgi:hypothetical protein
MSYFKLGSTIPVKIRVVSCGGAAVSGLAPQVSVVKKDSIPAGTELEATSTATPTDGTAMRPGTERGRPSPASKRVGRPAADEGSASVDTLRAERP